MMAPFTKLKFLKLEKRVQHKKCAVLLREIYETLRNHLPLEPHLFEHYHQYTTWMKEPLFHSENLKSIADQYHEHLRKSMISLKEHNLLPPIRKGDREPKRDFGNVAVYLDRMRSAYNVGNILRTVEALRLGPVYFHEKTPFKDHDKVIKTSMGASAHVPCFQVNDYSELPRPLIAIETGEKAESLHEFIFPESCTLIIGNEEYGISDEVLKLVDVIVEIPLYGAKNSINAASALAMAACQIQHFSYRK